jgi:hypothetical protein
MLSSAEFNELIARLKQKPEYSFLKSMGKKKIQDDYRVVGKPVGWRIKGKDNYKVPSKRFRAENPDLVYYENRINRSDVRKPNRLEQGGMMAKGGYVSKGEMVWKKISDSQKMDFLYKNFTPEITPRGQEILVGKSWNFLPKNVKIKFESKYANVEDYATGGSLKKKDNKHPKAFKIDLDVESRMGNNEHFEVGKMRGYGDALVSRGALQHNAPDNYKYSVKATNKYAKGGKTRKVEDWTYELEVQPFYPHKNIANRWLQDNPPSSLKYKLAVLLLRRISNPDEMLGITNDSQYARLLRSLEKAKGESKHEMSWRTNNYSLAEAEKWTKDSLGEMFYLSIETREMARGGGVKKKVKTQPVPTPNANVNPMDSYNVELVQSQGKDDKGNYYMFPKPANDNSRGVLFKKGGEIEENAKFKADNPNWTNEKLLAEYEKLNVDLQNFNNGFLKPKQVIGGGYKSSAIAKKLAKRWLEDRVAEYKMALEIRGVMAKGGMTKKEFQAKKMNKVMHEFKQGDLHSGRSGRIVKNREQAIAIGLSEAKRGWKNRNK